MVSPLAVAAPAVARGAVGLRGEVCRMLKI
jgi:hypothetical protein